MANNNDGGEDDEEDEEELGPAGSPLPQLTSLVVHGFKASDSIQQLARRLPHLTSLTIDTPRKGNTDYEELFRRLPRRSSLRTLVFSGCNDLDNTLTYILPTLTGLTTLHIESSHDLSPTLFAALRQVPLETLLLVSTNVTADDLLHLVDGAERLSTLRALSLSGRTISSWNTATFEVTSSRNAWSWERGLSANECHFDREKLVESWTLPEWGEGMKGRAEQVVVAAKRNGIRVEGTILEGIEGDKALREEEEKLDRMVRELEQWTQRRDETA
jgi:hypothetical protein